ncbi:MAG: hypothetical protein RI897_4280 [Verrucomicrobiota bacterium]
MHTPKAAESDPALSRLLGEWEVEGDLPARFADGVWRRVALEGGRGGGEGWAHWFLSWVDCWVRRPLGAASCLAVFLAVGVLAGMWRADAVTQETEAAWQQAYIHSVSPVAEVTSR